MDGPRVRGDQITRDHPAYGEYCYEHQAEMQDHPCDLLWGSNDVPPTGPEPGPEAAPIRKVAVYLPVSRQLAEDMGLLPDSRTPAEIAAAAPRFAQQRAEEARVLADRLARHAVLAGRDSTLGKLAVLHGPQYDHSADPVCYGCEFDGADGEPPAWPCSTWVLIDTETSGS